MHEEFWLKEAEITPPVAVLEAGGRIGVGPAKQIRELSETLKDRNITDLVLDMSEVTFISSSGIGALVVLTGEFSIHEGSVYLVGLSAPVLRALKLVNVDQFLKTESDATSALARLRQRSA